jgi:hypothetical protein
MIGAEAINPGINLVGIDIKASINFSTGLRDAFGFPSQASLPLGLSLDVIVNTRGLGHALNIGHRQVVL